MDSSVLWIIISALGTVGVLVGLVFLRKAIGNVENEKLREALLELTGVVEDTVKATNQAAVKSLRTASGKLTEENKAAVKEAVRDAAIQTVSRSTAKVLKKQYLGSALEQKVDTMIERTVGDVHKENLQIAAGIVKDKVTDSSKVPAEVKKIIKLF